MKYPGVIYCLKCPKTNLIRYIGQTKQSNPIKRYYQHKYQWTRSTHLSHLNAWIKSLFQENLFPKFEIIENNIPNEELNDKEIKFIELYSSKENNLVNTLKGGEQVYNTFIQKDAWKKKRLETLKTSLPWKEKSKRHSSFMKEKYKNGEIQIGINSLTKEKRKEVILKVAQSRKKSICSTDEFGNTLKVFNSILEARDFYNIKDSTHIVKVLKGKSKSGKTHGIHFEYF